MCEDCEKLMEKRKFWKEQGLGCEGFITQEAHFNELIERKLDCKKAHLKDLEEIKERNEFKNGEHFNVLVESFVEKSIEHETACIKILEEK